jgi:hypothetical protein
LRSTRHSRHWPARSGRDAGRAAFLSIHYLALRSWALQEDHGGSCPSGWPAVARESRPQHGRRSRPLISRVQARSEHHVRFGVLCPWPRRGVGISVKHDNLAGFSTCKGCPQTNLQVRDDEGEMLGQFRHSWSRVASGPPAREVVILVCLRLQRSLSENQTVTESS